MNNLYLWFPNGDERREYVIELLDLRPFRQKLGVVPTKHLGNLKEGLEKNLGALDLGMTKSPYFRLGEIYSENQSLALENDLPLWHGKSVYAKGLNRVYTMRSYMKRVGYWLVLQFRNNKTGREMRETIIMSIPKKRMSKNITSTMMLSSYHLQKAKILLEETDFNTVLDPKALSEALYSMETVIKNDPYLFGGDSAYLWEKMAWGFYNNDNIKAAETCLRNQARFQPGSSDPYLNLGSFRSEKGQYREAIDAYLEGLKVNPNDEYIHYNLAKHCQNYGMSEAAIKSLNDAILANPERAINYEMKAKIHFRRREYGMAVTNFQHAINLIEKSKDKQWRKMLGDIYLWLARSLREGECSGEALKAYKKAAGSKKIELKVDVMTEAANYFIEIHEFEEAKSMAENILKLEPDSKDATICLAKCLEDKGDIQRALWYKKKSNKL